MTRPLAARGGGGLAPGAGPDWFARAIGWKPERFDVDVDGAAIEVLAWGERGRQGLLFVHGMLAHAGWWSFIAPFLADNHRCAAVSLAGMGGSGWREHYSMARFGDDLAAAIRVAGLEEGATSPIIVAHSFGGIVARRFVERAPGGAAALVLVDSPVRRGGEWKPSQEGRTPRRFASREEAIDRFSLRPSQPCENGFLVEHVAAGSVSRQGDHWAWNFDPAIRPKMDLAGYQRDVDAGVPLAFVWGDRSLVCPPDMQAEAVERFTQSLHVVLPESGHHVMLDQPLAFVAALRAILAALGRDGALRADGAPCRA